MDDDVATQLRRQIAQATSEKESAKLELEGLKRTVDNHLLALGSILSSGADVSHDRLSAAIQAFDGDLRGRLDLSDFGLRDSLPAEGTYEVLRHSLSDAQKRCQDLNGDMLRVADANEELHGTLKTLKSTNKRLVEDVQKQTDDLSSLTQQRLLDVENLSRLEEAFRHEKSLWQQEAQRSIEEEQQRCDEEFNKMKEALLNQLNSCMRNARSIAQKAGGIKTMQSQLKVEMQGFTQTVGANMKKLERELIQKLAGATKHHNDVLARLKDEEHKLQVKLNAEKGLRDNEMDSWRNRHKAAEAELDDAVAKRERDCADLRAKVDALNSTREGEAAAVQSERTILHEKIETLTREVALLDAQMQTTRRKGLQLEAHLAQAEKERDRLQDAAETLRQQIRESDEHLNEAVRSNEALREQMEVQRLDLQHANERDLKTCKDMFEKRLDAAAQDNMNEQNDLEQRIRNLESLVGMKAGESQAVREALAEKTRQRDSLQRDVLMWKAQHELAAKMKADVDRDFTHFQQENLGGELQRLQEQHDEIAGKKAELEAARAALMDEVQQVKQSAKSKEIMDAARLQELQDQHRETNSELQRAKANLAEVEHALSLAKAEAATTTQQMAETRDGLEQDLARLTVEMEAEKREFERKIQAERMNCESMRESVERLRAEHRQSYKAAFEGPAHQLSQLEGAISEIQRSSDAELGALRQRSEKLRVRIEELENELARVQAKLEQTELDVQDTTNRVNLAKMNHKAARETLERERSLKNDEIQKVQRSIMQKTEHLKDSTRANESTRKRLLREVEEAKAMKARQLADADHRLQTLRSEFSAALEDRDASLRVSPTTGGSTTRLDSLLRENEHLRKLVSDHRHAATHIQDLGAQMQKSLTSMEDRATELRRVQG